MIRVLVADDQDLVRTGLSMILDAQPGIEVVAQVSNGRDAVERARHLRPDVCLVDIRMPELDGIEAAALAVGYPLLVKATGGGGGPAAGESG